jgi:hypothetical protein
MKTIWIVARSAVKANYYAREIKDHPNFRNRKVRIVSNAWLSLDGLNYQDTVFMLAGGYEKSETYNNPLYRQYVKLGAEEMIWEDVKHAAASSATPLLEIKVQDMNSVPEVYLNGVRLEGKVAIHYQWETSTDSDAGKHSIVACNINKDDLVMTTRTVERLNGECHCTDKLIDLKQHIK